VGSEIKKAHVALNLSLRQSEKTFMTIRLLSHPVFRSKLNAFLYVSGSSFTHKVTNSRINSITNVYYIVSYLQKLITSTERTKQQKRHHLATGR
jgi:hypothetical protein